MFVPPWPASEYFVGRAGSFRELTNAARLAEVGALAPGCCRPHFSAVYLVDGKHRKQPPLGVEMRGTIVKGSMMRNLAVVAGLAVAVCAVYFIWTGRPSFQCADLGGKWIETTGECIGSPYWEEFISR